MPTITEIQERLARYKDRETKILEGNQSYQVGRSQFTHADLDTVQAKIKELEHDLAMAQTGDRLSHNTTVFGGRR